MLTPTGGVKVMDFGIARAVADTSATMTQTAAVIGTAQYLSPEQARGETVDARSDIYSAGCLLYELLVGRPPFIGESPVSVAYQHVRETPVPPSQLDPVITPDIDAVTLKALAKDPADRYQSAREMKADITRVLSGQQATAVVPRMDPRMDQDALATRRAPAMAASQTQVAPPPPPTMLAPMAEGYQEEPEEEEEERKSRVGLAILITAVIILVLGGGAFALYQILTPEHDRGAGRGARSCSPTPRSRPPSSWPRTRLKVEVKKENGKDDETKGTVIDQDPKGGVVVDVGSTVTITVNVGPKTGKIPGGLVGKDVDEVERALREAGFENVDTKAAKNEDPDTEPNEVLSVSPKSGATAPLDGKVTVTYATGKSKVPNFNGVTEQRARELAEDAGFGEPDFTTELSDQPPGNGDRPEPQGRRVGGSDHQDPADPLRGAPAADHRRPPTTAPPTTPVPSVTPSPSRASPPG